MSAGEKVKRWFNDLEVIQDINSLNKRIKFRYGEFKKLNKSASPLVKAVPFVYVGILSTTYLLYVLLGVGEAADYSFLFGRIRVDDKFTEELGKGLREAATNPAVKELMQVVGSLAYDPFAGMLNQYGKADSINTGEFLRQFYGALILLPVLGNLINMGGQAATGGLVKNLGKPIEEAYFTLGLGFIGWQGLSPLLSESVLAAVTREAKRTFRQTRFKSGDLLDQWVRGEATPNAVANGLWDEGWRTNDIPTIMKMALKILSRSEADKLFELGKWTADQYKAYLRRLGYETDAINWIYYLENLKKQDEPKGISKGLAVKAFKLHTILEGEFRTMLAALGLSQEAINLEVEVIKFQEEIDVKEISVGQLENAFMQNVISPIEVIGALKELDYKADGITLLLETWTKKKAPKVLRLNQSSITNAVAKGILSPSQGLNKLVSIGFEEKDASIIIDSIKVEHNVAVKTPSEAMIIKALQSGLIGESEALTRLLAKGYIEKDADLIIRLSQTTDEIKLEIDDILEAYLYSVFDRNIAATKMQELGAKDNFIALKLDTIEKRRARLKIQFNASQVGKWFRQNLLSQDEALLKLATIGYSREDSLLFLESVSMAEPEPLSDRNIERAFLNGVIDETKAVSLFKVLGLSDENAKIRIDTIVRENGTVKAKVSVATLVSATRDGILTNEQLREKLVQLGLNDEDINLYLAIAEKRNTNVETRLSKADIMKGYKLGRLNDAEALALLESKGYSLEEAGYLLSLELREIETTDTYNDILNGNLSIDDGINDLLSLGYSLKEITEALQNLSEG